MLPERCQELLTAYLDGELSARQRRQVERLLRRSGEARSLFRKLQGDSHALIALGESPAGSPPPLEIDLSGPVLQTIADRRLKPGRRQSPARVPTRPNCTPAQFPAWTGLAAAAAVLFVVGLGSFLYFSREEGAGQGGPVAQNGAEGPSEPNTGGKTGVPHAGKGLVKKQRAPRKEAVDPKNRPGPGDDEEGPDDPLPPIVKAPMPPEEGPVEKKEPKGPGTVLGSGEIGGPDKFERVELRLPSLLHVHELDQAANRQRLLAELAQSTAFRAELICRDSGRAFDRLRPAVASQKIGLLIDQAAQARLKKGKADYAVFLDDITPAELADLLNQAGGDDRKAAAANRAERRFAGQLVVAPLRRLDKNDLIDLLGSDPLRARTASGTTSTGPLGTDVHRSLGDQTSLLIADALDGKRPRPGQAPTVNTGPDRLGLVMIYGPVRSRSASSEIKRFFATRKPPRAGSIQVLLVLRAV